MNVIEFHPDELIDREIRGELSAEDRRRLDEHLGRCAACRLELQLRADFDDELGTGEGAPSLPSLVAGAMSAAQGPKAPKDSSQDDSIKTAAVVVGGSKRWRRRLSLGVAAALIFGTGLAAAKSGFAGRAWDFARREVVSALAPSPEPPRAPAPAPKPRAPEAPIVALKPIESATSETSAAPAPSSAPVHPSAEPIARAAAAPSSESSASDTAASLFDRASAARRKGSSEAGALYRELVTRFPKSAEARLSLAVVARMQLDGGDAAGALAGFDAYLATGDASLREEAMAGRAVCLQRLGRGEEERRAWSDLLRSYPRSGYAAMAHKRLGGDQP